MNTQDKDLENPNTCGLSPICSKSTEPTAEQHLIALHEHLIANQEEGAAFAQIARQRLDRLIEAQQTIKTLREELEHTSRILEKTYQRLACTQESKRTLRDLIGRIARSEDWAANTYLGRVPVPLETKNSLQACLEWLSGNTEQQQV